MLSVDTNLLIYAADPDSPHHEKARLFIEEQANPETEFVLCELILVELYMQLRNKAVFKQPYSAQEAVAYCEALKKCPHWRCVDYAPEVSKKLWSWAAHDKQPMRRIIDARIGFTLMHHGVTHFATTNVRDFQRMGFAKVWNPLKDKL